MKNIRKQLQLYMPFFKAGTKTELAYKSQIVMWIIIAFVDIFFVVFLYAAIYRNSPNGMDSVVNGFTFYEMVLYMLTSFFFYFVINNEVTSYSVYTDIKEGTIAATLTKPVSYRVRLLFTFLGAITIDYAIVVLPFLVAVYAVFLGFGFLQVSAVTFVVNVLFFFLFSIIAALICDAISYFVGMLIFYTDHLFGLNMAREALQGFMGGQTIPLAYMGVLGVVFSYTPFAFLNSVPVLTLMCKLDTKSILIYLGVAVAWLLLIELVNHFMFRHAIKKLTVQGG